MGDSAAHWSSPGFRMTDPTRASLSFFVGFSKYSSIHVTLCPHGRNTYRQVVVALGLNSHLRGMIYVWDSCMCRCVTQSTAAASTRFTFYWAVCWNSWFTLFSTEILFLPSYFCGSLCLHLKRQLHVIRFCFIQLQSRKKNVISGSGCTVLKEIIIQEVQKENISLSSFGSQLRYSGKSCFK